MKDLNKEQILLIFALVILGVLAYFRFGDQVKSKRTPRGKVGLELEALEPCAETQFVDASMKFFSGEGRNIYAPPRDWLPLEPLLLDLPPSTELLAVGPFTTPGLAGEFYSAYYYIPEERVEGVVGAMRIVTVEATTPSLHIEPGHILIVAVRRDVVEPAHGRILVYRSARPSASEAGAANPLPAGVVLEVTCAGKTLFTQERANQNPARLQF